MPIQTQKSKIMIAIDRFETLYTLARVHIFDGTYYIFENPIKAVKSFCLISFHLFASTSFKTQLNTIHCEGERRSLWAYLTLATLNRYHEGTAHVQNNNMQF